MPQSLSPPESPVKCCLGYDFMAVLTESQKVYILCGAKFHLLETLPHIVDVAVSDSTLALVGHKGSIFLWEFD